MVIRRSSYIFARKLITMKKTFLLLISGFFISTSMVIGQEQQNKNSEIQVSQEEKAALKGSKTVNAKKANIKKSEAIESKKISKAKVITRKEDEK